MPQYVKMGAVSCAREASLIAASRIPFLVMMEGSSVCNNRSRDHFSRCGIMDERNSCTFGMGLSHCFFLNLAAQGTIPGQFGKSYAAATAAQKKRRTNHQHSVSLQQPATLQEILQ